jgi:prevent-host-death family protein
LVDEVHRGKGPVAITQRSKVKAVLVDANWHGKVEEELRFYRQTPKDTSFKLPGTLKLTGEVDRALVELKREREASFERTVESLK